MAEASSTKQSENVKSKKLKKSHTFEIGASLYMKEKLSDMIITLNVDGIVCRFPAHSVILAAQSEVFEKMVLGDFMEQKTREIRLQDIKPGILKKFLRYMYLGDVNIEGWEEALDLLKVAHMYLIEPLVQACSQYVQKHVDLFNVCHIYMITDFNLIKDFCLEVILSTACIVLRSDGFEVLDEESVIAVISNPKLNVDSEMCVVSSVLRWAATQCCHQNKSLTEGNISQMMIPFVKYLNMEKITGDEFEALPQFMQATKSVFSRQIFCASQHLRYHANHVNFKIMDNVSNYKTWDYQCEVTLFAFHVVYPLFLIGVNLISGGNAYINRMTLRTKADGVIVNVFPYYKSEDAAKKYACECGKRLLEYDILLNMPVLLQPHIVYHLCVHNNTLSCPPSTVVFPETNLIEMKSVGYLHSSPFTSNTGSFWGVNKLLYLRTPF